MNLLHEITDIGREMFQLLLICALAAVAYAAYLTYRVLSFSWLPTRATDKWPK